MIMILCYQFMNDFENVYFNLFFSFISVYIQQLLGANI